ncbi:MAG: DUF2071 domain-containing protein [Phycisphaeraceae bacterium]
MTWHDLLFAHWRVDAGALRRWVPRGLEIETFDGSAWLGVVPFYMSGVRMRCLPGVPTASAFPELNVRTYVTDGKSRGVWFFSLDAFSRLAVKAARLSFHLNYQYARMAYAVEADGSVSYRSDRTTGDADFEGRYRGMGEVFESEAGSLEEFLTERYCLFSANKRGKLWRGDIAHPRWPLQHAEADIERNTMTQPLGITLPGKPHLLFAKKLPVIAWRPVTTTGSGHAQ